VLLVALPILIGLGVWQLHRAEWKADVLLRLEANAEAPLVDLRGRPIPDDAEFRQVRLTLSCPAATPERRAGRNAEGQSGYAHLLPCATDEEPVWRNLGWTARPDPMPVDGGTVEVEGRLVRDRTGDWVLFETTTRPGLQPSAAPTVDTIPDNHRLYAVQWFSFAVILAAIYGAYLVRWRRQLAAAPPGR
jgi:surfeit locus 1 family protein